MRQMASATFSQQFIDCGLSWNLLPLYEGLRRLFNFSVKICLFKLFLKQYKLINTNKLKIYFAARLLSMTHFICTIT